VGGNRGGELKGAGVSWVAAKRKKQLEKISREKKKIGKREWKGGGGTETGNQRKGTDAAFLNPIYLRKTREQGLEAEAIPENPN